MADCTTETVSLAPGLLGRRRRWSGAHVRHGLEWGRRPGVGGRRRLTPGRAGRTFEQELRSWVAAAALAGRGLPQPRPRSSRPRSRVAKRGGREAGSRLVGSVRGVRGERIGGDQGRIGGGTEEVWNRDGGCRLVRD
jgi:hypothetical protein